MHYVRCVIVRSTQMDRITNAANLTMQSKTKSFTRHITKDIDHIH